MPAACLARSVPQRPADGRSPGRLRARVDGRSPRRLRPADRNGLGKYLICGRVAPQAEPAAAAVRVTPALVERALRVATHEHPFGPRPVVQAGRVRRQCDARLAAVPELVDVARATPRAGNQQHWRPRAQWATAAAPCSSTRTPRVKRPSENGALS